MNELIQHYDNLLKQLQFSPKIPSGRGSEMKKKRGSSNGIFSVSDTVQPGQIIKFKIEYTSGDKSYTRTYKLPASLIRTSGKLSELEFVTLVSEHEIPTMSFTIDSSNERLMTLLMEIMWRINTLPTINSIIRKKKSESIELLVMEFRKEMGNDYSKFDVIILMDDGIFGISASIIKSLIMTGRAFGVDIGRGGVYYRMFMERVDNLVPRSLDLQLLMKILYRLYPDNDTYNIRRIFNIDNLISSGKIQYLDINMKHLSFFTDDGEIIDLNQVSHQNQVNMDNVYILCMRKNIIVIMDENDFYMKVYRIIDGQLHLIGRIKEIWHNGVFISDTHFIVSLMDGDFRLVEYAVSDHGINKTNRLDIEDENGIFLGMFHVDKWLVTYQDIYVDGDGDGVSDDDELIIYLWDLSLSNITNPDKHINIENIKSDGFNMGYNGVFDMGNNMLAITSKQKIQFIDINNSKVLEKRTQIMVQPIEEPRILGDGTLVFASNNSIVFYDIINATVRKIFNIVSHRRRNIFRSMVHLSNEIRFIYGDGSFSIRLNDTINTSMHRFMVTS
jgi:hypothetical protein